MLVVALTLILAACGGIFVANAYREFHQVVVTIEFTGQPVNNQPGRQYTSNVLWGNLWEHFNMNAGHQIQGGARVEDVLDNFTQSLSRNQLLLARAIDHLTTMSWPAMPHRDEGNGQPGTRGRDVRPLAMTGPVHIPTIPIEFLEELLSPGEVYFARNNVNEQFVQAMNNVIAELERDAGRGQETDDDEERSAPRNQPGARDQGFNWEDYAHITWDDVRGENGLFNFTDHLPAATDFRYWTREGGRGTQALAQRAWRQLSRNLDRPIPGVRDYYHFYRSQLEARILNRFRQEAVDAVAHRDHPEFQYINFIGVMSTITPQVILDEYIRMVNENIRTVSDHASYNSAWEGATAGNPLLFHLAGNTTFRTNDVPREFRNYARVRSMLMSFSGEQRDLVGQLRETVYNNRGRQAFFTMRNQIAFGSPLIDSEHIISSGLTVNISNVEYDPDENAYVEIFTERSVPFLVVLARIADEMAQVEAQFAGQPANVIAMERLRVFDEWMWRINDDPGMTTDQQGNPRQELHSYVISPVGQPSQFVPEYNALARAVVAGGLGSVSVFTGAPAGSPFAITKTNMPTGLAPHVPASLTTEIERVEKEIEELEEELRLAVTHRDNEDSDYFRTLFQRNRLRQRIAERRAELDGGIWSHRVEETDGAYRRNADGSFYYETGKVDIIGRNSRNAAWAQPQINDLFSRLRMIERNDLLGFDGDFAFELDGITFVVNDFGIHLVFVTDVALVSGAYRSGDNGSNVFAGIDFGAFSYGAYMSHLDFLLHVVRVPEIELRQRDENGNFIPDGAGGYKFIELEGYVLTHNAWWDLRYEFSFDDFNFNPDRRMTVADVLAQRVRAEREQNYYVTWEQAFFEAHEVSVQRDNGIYNRMLNRLTDLVGQ